MAAFLLYLLKSTCCLAVFYLGYKGLLSNETFFRFNRRVLLIGTVCCLLLPFFKIKTESAGIIQQPVVRLEKYVIREFVPAENAAAENEATEQTGPEAATFP